MLFWEGWEGEPAAAGLIHVHGEKGEKAACVFCHCSLGLLQQGCRVALLALHGSTRSHMRPLLQEPRGTFASPRASVTCSEGDGAVPSSLSVVPSLLWGR